LDYVRRARNGPDASCDLVTAELVKLDASHPAAQRTAEQGMVAVADEMNNPPHHA
jgi:hypothetical protein